jgi:hypothetical protein
MTQYYEAADLGQAIWLDYIRRFFITSGDLQTLVDDGLLAGWQHQTASLGPYQAVVDDAVSK